MINKTQLLCTFTTKEQVDNIINKIKETYIVQYNKVLIIENVENVEEQFCIYNIEKKLGIGQLNNTILIHRKRDFNTLYTINSLNQLIWSLNGGAADNKFEVPWQNYQNIFLLSNAGKLRMVKTQLKDIKKF